MREPGYPSAAKERAPGVAFCKGGAATCEACVGSCGIEEHEAAAVDVRYPECVANWPECESGAYDPRCCRFPKSCSCVDVDRLPDGPGSPHRFVGALDGPCEACGVPVSAAVSPAEAICPGCKRPVSECQAEDVYADVDDAPAVSPAEPPERTEEMLRFIDAVSPFVRDVLDEPFPWKHAGQVAVVLTRAEYDEAVAALEALRD